MGGFEVWALCYTRRVEEKQKKTREHGNDCEVEIVISFFQEIDIIRHLCIKLLQLRFP